MNSNSLRNLRPFNSTNAVFYGRRGGIKSGESRRAISAMKREECVIRHTLFKFWGKDRDLTIRQWRFVVAFMGDAMGCATRAARLAGYSQKWAKESGYRLIHHPKVLRAIRIIADRLQKGLSLLEA